MSQRETVALRLDQGTSHPERVRDAGSAVVDFALVGGLLTVLFASLLQLALVLHVRSTLADCAAESARYAARADRSPADAPARARQLVADELSVGYAERLVALDARTVEVDGVQVVEVELDAPLPLLGLAGPAGVVTARGHAVAERQPEATP